MENVDQYIANAKANIEVEGLTVRDEYVELVKQHHSGIITKEEFLTKIKELIG